MNPSYCLGFLFSRSLDRVMLIKKKKPEWQAGLLNGVGGKIEPNETSDEAMVREFYEETGIWVRDWKRVAGIQFNYEGDDCSTVHLFAGIGDWLTMAPRRDLPERAGWYFFMGDSPRPMIPNLKWMIPFCRTYLEGSQESLRLTTPAKVW